MYAQRVACIGASITYGATIPEREKYAYPAQLGALLGVGYEVFNYGVSGCTMLKKAICLIGIQRSICKHYLVVRMLCLSIWEEMTVN